MSKQTAKMLVPKLRFPEFRNAGEWKKIKLIDVADKKIKWSFIGGPFGSNLKSSDYVIEGIRIIQLQNIGDAEFMDDYKIFTSEEKADELLSNNIYPGEIILSKMGDPVGRACLIPNAHPRYVMCSDGIRLVVDEELFSKYFIYTLINSIQFRSLLEKTATGSTRKRIGLDDLKNLPMIVPKPAEQQKIADCLSSIDELITAQSQKIDTLKAHKKGLMQQLFPAQGETVPKLRFPEFRDAGAWEEKPLGEVCNFIDGYAFSSSAFVVAGKNTIQVIRITDINNKNRNSDKVYVSDSFVKQLDLDKYTVRKGDLLLSLTGAAGFNFFIWDSESEAILNQRTMKIAPKEKLNSSIINLLEALIYNKINKHGSGQNNNLSKKPLMEILFNFPTPPEQQKIADCLSSIDELITAQSQKIDTLKAHKKGLMQQLFPSTDEVNG